MKIASSVAGKASMTSNVRSAMVLDVCVEISKGSRNKYELDETTGKIRLDRVLYSPLHYPVNYGFITGTLAEDGDRLDILIVRRSSACRREIRDFEGSSTSATSPHIC